MPTDACLANLARRDWLTAGPFNKLVAPFIDALREQRYGEHTIRAYLGCLAHFSYWIRIDGIEMANLDASLIKRFLRHHLPACACPAPCYPSVASSGAALRHMLGLFPGDQSASRERDPVAVELERFGEYLANVCGLAPATRERRVKQVGAFLARAFGSQPPALSLLSGTVLDEFFDELSIHLRPASLRVVGNSLRSYFRYRALLGEPTAALVAAMPRIADW